MMGRISKSLFLLAVGALVAAALVSAPAAAAAACPKYKPQEPVSDSENRAEAVLAKVVKVTDKATEAKPLVIEYDHGPAFWFIQDPVDAEGQRALVEDTKWFNIQVQSKARDVGLYIRQQWDPNSPDDFDLYLYDKSGGAYGQSATFNWAEAVAPGQLGGGDGGLGYEQVLGLLMTRCQGMTIESRAFTTPGRAMQLVIWLGDIG